MMEDAFQLHCGKCRRQCFLSLMHTRDSRVSACDALMLIFFVTSVMRGHHYTTRLIPLLPDDSFCLSLKEILKGSSSVLLRFFLCLNMQVGIVTLYEWPLVLIVTTSSHFSCSLCVLVRCWHHLGNDCSFFCAFHLQCCGFCILFKIKLTNDKSFFLNVLDKKTKSTAVAQISIFFFFIEASSSQHRYIQHILTIQRTAKERIRTAKFLHQYILIQPATAPSLTRGRLSLSLPLQSFRRFTEKGKMKELNESVSFEKVIP